MWSSLANLVSAELSGHKAKEHIEYITQYYRSPGSSGFHKATDYVAKKFEEYGLDVEIQRYPLDGTRTVLGRTYPPVWEPISAELKLRSPVEEDLVSFEKTPSCLPWYCASTPPEGIEAELADVGEGDTPECYEGKDVSGKAVLVGPSPRYSSFREAYRLAIEERGALGIITDQMLYLAPPVKTRQTAPDLVQLLRLPPPNAREAWAFSVSYPHGEKLRKLLQTGPVKIWARIQTKIFAGEGQNVTATIPGSTNADESILFIAHTSAGTKPGANCAAGPALLLEIARMTKVLIDSGRISRPKRSIVFQIGPEGPVSYEYLEKHMTTLDKIVSAFCFDSVGHDQHQLKSALLLCKCPDSLPHFINDFCESLMDSTPKETNWVFHNDPMLPLVNFVPVPYTTWSDNHNLVSFGVPCPLFMSLPDLYFHSQLLTPDTSDPAVLKRCGLVTTVATLILASAGVNDAISIAKEIAARSEFRLSQIGIKTMETLSSLLPDEGPDFASNGIAPQIPAMLARGINELAYSLVRDLKALDSVRNVLPSTEKPVIDRLVWIVDALKAQLKQKKHSEEQMLVQFAQTDPSPRLRLDDETALDPEKVVPKRLVIHTGLGFPLPGMSYADHVRIAGELHSKDPRINFTSLRIIGDEIWNFIDGHRSIREIAEAVQFEFDYEIDVKYFIEMFLTLEQSGYIELATIS